MSTNRNLLTSPVGEILFMAGENAVVDSKTGKANYSIKLALDTKTGQEFFKAVEAINEAKVVTEKSYRGKSEKLKNILKQGKYTVEAKSQYKPTIYDSKGNELEEAPYFFADSTGTAQMIVQPYKGDKGGTINLIGIIVHEIKNSEGTCGEGSDRETRLAQLRAAVEAATK